MDRNFFWHSSYSNGLVVRTSDYLPSPPYIGTNSESVTRHLVGLGPIGEHNSGAVVRWPQQVRDHAVLADRPRTAFPSTASPALRRSGSSGRIAHGGRRVVHPSGHVIDRRVPGQDTAVLKAARTAGNAGSLAGPADRGPPRSTPAGSRLMARPARRRGMAVPQRLRHGNAHGHPRQNRQRSPGGEEKRDIGTFHADTP